MSESREIPNGWANVRLSNVCDKITDGSHFSPKSVDIGFPYVTVKDLKNDTIDFSKCLKITKKDYNNLSKNDCNPLRNDVLFSKDGTVGKVALINYDLQFVVLSSLAILRPHPKIILSKYLFYILKSSQFLLQALNQKKGVAIRRIILRDLKEINLNLPPIPEQQRIVAKIEELFSSLDKGIESLKTAQQQLKVYRQAVLKWAFEGRLTNRNVVEGELPEGWKKVNVGKVVKTIDGDRGPNYPKKDEFLQKGYCLFLSTKNVREDSFVFEDNIFISKEKDEKLRGGKLQLSDVVITTRGTLGNVALYDEKIPYKHIRINSGMLILRRTNESLNNYYLMKFITSPIFISQLKEKQTGTAQQQIPANVLREIEIPLAPIPEQHTIVAEIESRLSVCDNIEESIEHSLKQSEALRQSILKKAFEGKLVPQDPNDEPASVLLAWIKAEREKDKPANPPRR
jgi:type I restriction enzyme S subunit